MNIVTTLLLAAAALAGPSQAQLPARAGHVNDYAHVLDAGDIIDLERQAAEVLRQRRVEVVVVLIRNAPGGDAQALARRLVEHWGVGGPPVEGRSGVVFTLDLAGGIGIAVNEIAAPYLSQEQVDALLDPVVRNGLSERRFGPALRQIVERLGRMLEP